jgi:hypothetical protein
VATTGTPAIARLTKRDAELLFGGYDADPVTALTVALAKVLDQDPSVGFADLVHAAPLPDSLRAGLLAGQAEALDELARRLNEDRDLASGESGPCLSGPEWA